LKEYLHVTQGGPIITSTSWSRINLLEYPTARI